jgi:hypothetical protein
MKLTPLFRLTFVYHPKNQKEAAECVLALSRAFAPVSKDPAVSNLDTPPDVWDRVEVKSITSQAAWNELDAGEGLTRKTLYVVLVTEQLVDDPGMTLVLDSIATRINESAKTGGGYGLLAYSLSTIALKKLPPVFKGRQVKNIESLGEDRIIAHKLGLIALHRARLLLGENEKSETLKLFISHAKHDGVFFARALENCIKDIPELDAWYDAQNLGSGDDWFTEIREAAGSCVFVALRTNAYELRSVCLDEFMTAYSNGMPIVVVDALMQPVSAPSSVPFASVPNVRIDDGNTYRVLTAALREHLRLLLMRSVAGECAPVGSWPRVWLRLPTLAATKLAFAFPSLPESRLWLVPKAQTRQEEFSALRDWLAQNSPPVALEYVESLR